MSVRIRPESLKFNFKIKIFQFFDYGKRGKKIHQYNCCFFMLKLIYIYIERVFTLLTWPRVLLLVEGITFQVRSGFKSQSGPVRSLMFWENTYFARMSYRFESCRAQKIFFLRGVV